ncbi:MAG TPA: CBS domain-containing protein [Longimicrobium sp.]|nr:CBS domain-containing protein [Longimicrobium sp.]
MTNASMFPHPGSGLATRDLMTPADALATVAPEWTLREVAELLTARHVSGAPVLQGSTVAGVVSASDLLEFAATADHETPECADPGAGTWREEADEPAAGFFVSLGMDLGEALAAPFADASGPERNAFDEHTAEEVMSRRILSIPPGASVAEAARVMLGGGVHRLLVIEDERLVGLLSATDVLRAVAEGSLA